MHFLIQTFPRNYCWQVLCSPYMWACTTPDLTGKGIFKLKFSLRLASGHSGGTLTILTSASFLICDP